MSKRKKGLSPGKALGLIVLGLAGLGLLLRVLLDGKNIALINPKGMIAQEQMNLGLIIVGVMLFIAVPTLFMLYFTAWKYRESNTKAVHDPDVGHSKLLNAGMWLIPIVFAAVLAGIMWSATHKLEPQKTIASETKPLTIQVVSLRWKWLFIYPELNIATVNHVQIPVNTPVKFELTADEAPMSSFWVPNLGGMLYTMTGHINQLNLMANTPGDYPGSSGEINGAGFAGMKFTVRASDVTGFDQWVQEVRQSPDTLDTATYQALLKPSENHPLASYSAAESGLYAKIVMKYMDATGHDHKPAEYHGGH